MSLLLPPFQIHEPATLDEAVRTLQDHPDADLVAGGTDLLPNYKWQLNTRPHVLSLHRIEALREITPTRIGALATLSRVQQDPAILAKVPVVAQTAGLIASPLIRNSATVGGNVMLENRCFFFNQAYLWRESINFCLKANGTQCHVVPQETKCYATFSADLPGAFIALDAEYELAGPAGARRVPAREFYHNDGIDRHQRRPGEVLTFVHLPEDASQWRASYQKLRQREAWDFPELGIAAALRFDGSNLSGFRLVANALESAPKVLDDLGTPHLGRPLTDAAIDEIAQQVETSVRPVKNTNLSPSYRKRMSRVFARRALMAARGPA